VLKKSPFENCAAMQLEFTVAQSWNWSGMHCRLQIRKRRKFPNGLWSGLPMLEMADLGL
jgi:hypothetical protein